MDHHQYKIILKDFDNFLLLSFLSRMSSRLVTGGKSLASAAQETKLGEEVNNTIQIQINDKQIQMINHKEKDYLRNYTLQLLYQLCSSLLEKE